MSLVSQNIKQLRKRLGLTQEQFAEKIGTNRSLLGAYEEGRADPRLNNLLNMAKEFGGTVDMLISKELGLLSDEELKDLQAANADAGNGDFKVLAITVDEAGQENIELVPQKASAGYLNGYSDPEYLEELPRFKLPV